MPAAFDPSAVFMDFAIGRLNLAIPDIRALHDCTVDRHVSNPVRHTLFVVRDRKYVAAALLAHDDSPFDLPQIRPPDLLTRKWIALMNGAKKDCYWCLYWLLLERGGLQSIVRHSEVRI